MQQTPSSGAREASSLEEFAAFSVEVGSDTRLIQGAGGNYSLKDGSTIWITASGTRFADAESKEILVALDRDAAKGAVLQTEKLSPYVLGHLSPAGLRPSIETALHVLLPHKAVMHLHSVNSIAAGMRDDLSTALSGLADEMNIVVVPYAKPGISLARAVQVAIGDRDDDSPLLLLLRNHGLVVGANSVASLRAVVTRVEHALSGRTEPLVATEISNAQVASSANSKFRMLTKAGVLSDDEMRLLDGSRAITPDAAVFLGATPFSRDFSETTACLLNDDGSVSIRKDLGADEQEIALSMIDVARVCGPGINFTTLSDSDILELVDWDAEKWRQAMKR